MVKAEDEKMTEPPNIIGPIGSLVGLGIMAYAAKGVIDIVKDTTEKQKKKLPGRQYKEPIGYTPRIESDRVQRGLNKMLYK